MCFVSRLSLRCQIEVTIQTDPVAARLNTCVYILKELRQYVSQDVLKLVYFAHFHSVLSYNIALSGNSPDWYGCFKVQNRPFELSVMYQIEIIVNNYLIN